MPYTTNPDPTSHLSPITQMAEVMDVDEAALRAAITARIGSCEFVDRDEPFRLKTLKQWRKADNILKMPEAERISYIVQAL